MLAGLLELLPWLHQWHSAPSDDYGGDSPASYFSAFLEGQCQELGLTHDDLRAWRPPAKARGRAKTSSAPKTPKPKADKPKRTKKTPAPPEPTTEPEPFALAPPDAPSDDGWKSTKKKSKKSPAKPPTSRRKPSEPA
jgi:hypothetical protein